MNKQSLFTAESRTTTHLSSIKDNRSHGKVGEWLKEVMAEGSALSIVSAKQYDMLSPGVKDVIKPGVLLCLRERKRGDDEQQKAKEAINVTAPYFLVYVRNDGTVRFSFTQPKQTLEVFRSLCQGKREAYTELCELFNKETEGGMERYNALVERATSDIAALFRKRSGAKLSNDRSALLIPDTQQANGPDDFDLVTWLVIKRTDDAHLHQQRAEGAGGRAARAGLADLAHLRYPPWPRSATPIPAA
ncbi:MAG: hypothetical protein WAT74_17600 [Flavobacteriales bacterium]